MNKMDHEPTQHANLFFKRSGDPSSILQYVTRKKNQRDPNDRGIISLLI